MCYAFRTAQWIKVAGIAITAILMMACGSSDPPVGPEPGDTTVRLNVVTSGLQSPVHIASPPGDGRLFIVEQRGRIRVFKDGQLLSTPFLDIAAKVGCCGERGLLSVAFHPEFTTNGLFYINYTDVNGDTRVERYHAATASDVADGTSASLLLGIDQPFSNHNGGHLLFGPDGLLYIPMGDGGSGGDPQGNGQSHTSLLGKILRLDVSGGTPEIWAYGLRNPWRIAFDRVDNTLYVADVGQNTWEEINVVPAGERDVNYGWNIMEGRHCYSTTNCNQTGLSLPVVEYNHSEGCSVTGGLVYRGSAIPALRGHYFYADYCGGWVRSFRYAGGVVTAEKTWSFGNIGNVTSFGEDANGELYVVSASGTIYRLSPA
jgi:glucose/arabinose dehydrogenase